MKAEGIQKTRLHATGNEARVVDYGAQVFEVRRDSVHAGGRESGGKIRSGGLPVGSVDDEFGQHRIVKTGDLSSGFDPTVNSHPPREMDVSQRAGRRLKISDGIFGVKPYFQSNAARGAFEWLPIERLAGSNAQHQLDQIEAGNHLSDGVLDLKARIHFEEVIALARDVIENSTVPAER